jgi:glycosyl transferase, family 25
MTEFAKNRLAQFGWGKKPRITIRRASFVQVPKKSVEEDLSLIRKKKETEILEWPVDSIPEIYAISIRNERYQALQQRLENWSQYLKLWPGTDGKTLPPQPKLPPALSNVTLLTRGQIGCFDSHFRLWKHMIENNIDRLLILEDDANLRMSSTVLNQIMTTLRELNELQTPWDICFLGHKTERRTPFEGGSHLFRPTDFCGLFTYLLTLEGAKKLVQNARPFRHPCDIYVMHQWKQGRISAVAVHPPLCFVTTLESDTRNIK